MSEIEPKWTPGPWRIEEIPYIHVRSDAGCVLAGDYTTPANANLIAAAPTMADALYAVIDVLRDTSTPFPPAVHDQITDALARAEGKP